MKTTYKPVKLPKQVKSAIMGEEPSINVYRVANEIVFVYYCQKTYEIICRLVKENIIERYLKDQASQFTPHGIEVLNQLIENQKEIKNGIPMEFYKKGNPKIEKVCEERQGRASIYTGEYLGKRFWSDGTILFFGDPVMPYETVEKGNCDSHFPNPDGYNNSAQPVGFSETRSGVCVWLYDGTFAVAIRQIRYDLIMKYIPDPVFRLNGNIEPVLVFSKNEDEVKALVMPVRPDSIPVNIWEIIREVK